MNFHARQVRAVLDDPHSTTAAYRAAWNEWQTLVFQQNVATACADRQRTLHAANGWIAHTPVTTPNHFPAA